MPIHAAKARRSEQLIHIPVSCHRWRLVIAADRNRRILETFRKRDPATGHVAAANYGASRANRKGKRDDRQIAAHRSLLAGNNFARHDIDIDGNSFGAANSPHVSPALLASIGIFCVATNAALSLRKGFIAASIELQTLETYASSDGARYFTTTVPFWPMSRQQTFPSVTTSRGLEENFASSWKSLRVPTNEILNEVCRKATIKHNSLSVSSRQRRYERAS